ncbi:restriction endonuclease subunit S [Streptomyces sp. MS1.AVA.3]|uniref:restriction endonuclease subunit S n=1 Tax=Streptomyces decoyicus TaxID=249567 RepID=UPI0030C18EAD
MALTVSPAELVAKAEHSARPGLLARHPTWERIPLGDVADVLNGFAFKSHSFNHDGDGLPLIRIRDVERGTTATYYSGSYEPQYLINPGDMVVGMDGDFRVSIWRGPTALLNQRVCKISIRDTKHYDQRFLLYVLQGYLDAIGTATSSVTVKHLSSRSLLQIPLPLPPLQEQHRIVEALEDHISRLDAAQEAVRKSLSRTTHLRRSTIRRLLRGEGLPKPHDGDAVEEFNLGMQLPPHTQPWDLPSGWAWTTIGSLFRVYVGTTPSRKAPELWSGTVPWVSSGEVNFGRISSTREHISEAAVGNRDTRLHPPGTVMIAMIGEGKTRGQASILDIEAAHNQNCASIRVSETRVLPEYIYLVLEERYQQSRKASSGGNQPALNKSKVESIPVPLPPISTQRQIVTVVEEFTRTSNRCRLELEKTLAMAGQLKQALFSRAVVGHLVRQDPSDEPASILLDRILAKRETQGSKSKPRRAPRRPRDTNSSTAPPPPPSPASLPGPTAAVQQELPL